MVNSRPYEGFSLCLLTPLFGLIAFAACHEPATSPDRRGVQDSVTLALPSVALGVEITPATIALGGSATVRVTATNRSTTPVTLDVPCAANLSYEVHTLAGELPSWISRLVCPGTSARMPFAAGEVRVVEFRLPRLGVESATVSPGEYQVRATLGDLRSAPVRLTVTP